MSILVLIDTVVINDQKSLITFDFVRYSDYWEFGKTFGLETTSYEAINSGLKPKSSFVLIENYPSPDVIIPDGYYELNLGILKMAEMSQTPDYEMFIASFIFKNADISSEVPLFSKYTGMPYWFWPRIKENWGYAQEEIMMVEEGRYELTARCKDSLARHDSSVLLIHYWNKENIKLLMQRGKKEMLKYLALICVNAYMTHSAYSFLWWLRSFMPKERILLIHNNLADSESIEARELFRDKHCSISIAPYRRNRKESGLIHIKTL